MTNEIKDKVCYLCGDMLHKSMFDYRKQQKDEIAFILSNR